MKRPRLLMMRETVEFLKANGAEDIEPTFGGKHPKIRFRFRDQNLITVTSISPSDRGAAKKQVAQLRRMLREATARATAKSTIGGEQ